MWRVVYSWLYDNLNNIFKLTNYNLFDRQIRLSERGCRILPSHWRSCAQAIQCISPGGSVVQATPLLERLGSRKNGNKLCPQLHFVDLKHLCQLLQSFLLPKTSLRFCPFSTQVKDVESTEQIPSWKFRFQYRQGHGCPFLPSQNIITIKLRKKLDDKASAPSSPWSHTSCRAPLLQFPWHCRDAKNAKETARKNRTAFW